MDNTQEQNIDLGASESTPTEHLVDQQSVNLGTNPNNQGDDPMPEGFTSPSANAFAEEIPQEGVNPQAKEPQQDNQTDWENSAKYFQSEKDKLAAENEQLKKYKQLGDLVDSRPDIQQEILKKVRGDQGQPQQEASKNQAPPEVKPPEDFDPWEAYNKPESESFKFRKHQEAQTVNQALSQYDSYQNGQRQKEQVMTQLDHAIKDAGMSQGERGDFMQWAQQPMNNLRPSELVNMYRAAKGSGNAPPPPPPTSPNVEAARRVQGQPTSAGIVQGERPTAPSGTDAMWDGIMNAAGKSKIP